MSTRRLPVRPDLEQLKHQAKDLLRALRRGDAEAAAELRDSHADPVTPADTKLAGAQRALARSYGASSWTRLVHGCRLADAIWDDDQAVVLDLISNNPHLLDEDTVPRQRNWGPPMSYAATIGRDRIVSLLHSLGPTDPEHALGRAALQSHVQTARLINALTGAPRPAANALDGPAYTLSVSGTALLFELGARVYDDSGRRLAPVATVLETDNRNPPAKHAILEMYVEHGLDLPDTPMMAIHRGRIDLLEKHVRHDPDLLTRGFSYRDIFPPETGCLGNGWSETRLASTTLLHVCAAFAEIEIARWLLDRGMHVDSRAGIDPEGFGGHTALFHTVVAYPNYWDNVTGEWSSIGPSSDAAMARLLLDRGADPNARASLHVPRTFGDGPRAEARNITPLGWGALFSNRLLVSEPAVRLIAERGGHL